MAMQHAAMNAHLGVRCEFLLLNPPALRDFAAFREGVDFAAVDAERGDTQTQMAVLDQMLRNTRPGGTTPLGERLREVQHRIQYDYFQLAQRGLRCVVIVATDGLPTCAGSNLPSPAAQQEVVQVLRRITCELRAFAVVRLTTDEDDVVAYYNRVDEEEELALEVVDDLESEARELREKGNAWLTYSPLLHMLREAGTSVRLLDAVDERRLNPLEVQALAGHLVQRSDGEAPLPGDPADFYRAVRSRLSELPLVYDPLRRCPMPCINEALLRPALGATWGALLLKRCMPWRRQSDARAPLIRG